MAGSIKRQLGMSVTRRDDLGVAKEPPQSELVQSITGGATGANAAAAVTLALATAATVLAAC